MDNSLNAKQVGTAEQKLAPATVTEAYGIREWQDAPHIVAFNPYGFSCVAGELRGHAATEIVRRANAYNALSRALETACAALNANGVCMGKTHTAIILDGLAVLDEAPENLADNNAQTLADTKNDQNQT